MKRRTIITSVLVIVLCLGLISGSTFALFTSESSVNIAVTSGKVKLVASLDTLKVYSANPNLTGDSLVPVDKIDPTDNSGTLTGTFAGTYYYETMPVVNNTTGTFANGGKAVISDSDQTLTLTNVTPGDKVSVNVNIENSSNVKIKYRIRVNVLENENEETASSLDLFNGLVTKIDGTVLNGVIRVNNWTLVDPSVNNGEIADVPVEIYLPLDAGNEYQGKTTQIRIIVEAVQNNAATQTELETINDYLAAQSPKNPTMYDAILDVKSALSLATYADAFAKVQDYLWNVDTDRFYVVSEEDGFEYKYFKAYTYDEFSALTAQTYSVYAYDGGTTSWTGKTVNVNVGFDAGVTTDISSVSFARTGAYGKDFVIRTNSAATTLTVNAPKDTVRHYGVSGTVNIIAVAGSSYHENGKVAFVEITNGRLALEKDSQVSRVHFASTVVEQGQPTEDKVFNEIIVSYDSSLDNNLPKFSRDDVDIPTQGKLVVELQKVDNTQPEPETTSDFIWLTKQGIFEQIKVSGEGDKISEDAKWADDGAVDDDTQKAAQQIANNIGRDNQGNIDVKVTVKESSETKNYEVSLNENRDLVVYESNSTSTEPVATISESGNITVGSQDYNIALTNNNENTTELVVSTTGDNPEIVTKVDAVKTSGLSETKKEEVKTEVVEEAVIEELGNDVNNIARIKAKVYTTLEAALADAVDGDVVVLLQDRIGSNKEANLSINKNITLDLGNKVLETKKLTVYSLDNLIIKNGTINGQLRIGEHQSTKVKYKTDGSYMTGYHPLAPAKNVILNNITINSGNDVALYFTNIEDDLTRANSSNPVDRDLYGKYIYKTGYTSKEQYNAHNRDEVFTACADKDKVTIINCNINSNKTITGNMHEENKRVFTVIEDGRLYTEVLDVQSGTFNNDSLGRFISEGKYLVGIESGKFVVQENAPETYTAKINNVYYTYEGGANDAITYANLGETVYIKENANVEKTIGRNQSITLVYEADNIGYTGATPIFKYELKSNKNDNVEVFYTDYEPVAEVYKTTNNTISPSMTSSNLVGTYPTVAEAFAAANINGQFSCVRLVDDYEGGDDAKYYYTDTAYSAGAHSGSSVRFDLNGYTWTYTGTNKALVITTTSGSSAKDTIIVDTSSGKTGQILAPNGTCIYKENSSTENTRIQSGTFIAKNQAVNINKLSASKKSGKWYIEGGTFQSTTGAAISLGWSDSSGLLEISGGTFISGGTAKTITASFNNSPSVTLKGGTYNTDPTTYGTKFSFASGKSAIDNGDGTWTIK